MNGWTLGILLLSLSACDSPPETSGSDHLLQDQQDMLNDAKTAADALEGKLQDVEKKLNKLRDEGKD